MNSLLETIGSFIIGGLILLIVISFNINMNTNSIDNVQNAFLMNNSVVNASIFNYDMYKMGYGVSSNAITKADSNNIIFSLDIDNNSIKDSVEYKSGTIQDLSGTVNPKDKPIFRRLNGGSYKSVGVVTKLTFSYFDSVGSSISYASLTLQANRNKIRTIKIDAAFESNEPRDTTYSGLNWSTSIRPKSLR